MLEFMIYHVCSPESMSPNTLKRELQLMQTLAIIDVITSWPIPTTEHDDYYHSTAPAFVVVATSSPCCCQTPLLN